MTFPIRIFFLDSGPSAAIEAKVRGRAEKLERFSEIECCDVWISSPHRHHRQGPIYGLRILLTVRGENVVVDLQPDEDDVFVAIRQAFDAARRRLEDEFRRQTGRVKAHPRAPLDPSTLRRVPPRISKVSGSRKPSRVAAKETIA